MLTAVKELAKVPQALGGSQNQAQAIADPHPPLSTFQHQLGLLVQNAKLVKHKALCAIQTALSKVKDSLQKRISLENVNVHRYKPIQELHFALKVASSEYGYNTCKV